MGFNDQERGEVRIGREAEAAAFFGRPILARQGSARVPIRIVARGVDVSGIVELEEWNGGLARLPEFFDDLAKNWRGWSDTKQWQDDGPTFEMSATHDGVGSVTIHLELRSLPYDAPGSWKLAVEVPIEPGALEAIARAIRRLAGRS